jgi:phosphate transport system substrate-binding protein
MRNARKWLTVIAAVTSLTLVAAACGGDDDGSDGGETGSGATGSGVTGSEELSGTITVSGSSTVQPITNLVAELFNQEVAAGVAITVDGPGTSDGFVLFCDGETDVQDASRAISEEEIATCGENGIEYVELEVAFDGITVMTNPANDAVGCLNTGDLYALMGPESEGFASWSDANALAAEVGGTGNFPDAPLEITAPGEESGTYDAFLELAGFEDFGVERGLSEDEAAAMRKDYQASPDDNVIISAMEGTPTALGYVGFAFAEEAGDAVKEIAVDGGSGCVDPSRETIADGSYPLSRSLYIYVNKAKVAESPALEAFIDFYVSDTGLLTAVPEVGYVELPADRIDATRAAWESGKAA